MTRCASVTPSQPVWVFVRVYTCEPTCRMAAATRLRVDQQQNRNSRAQRTHGRPSAVRSVHWHSAHSAASMPRRAAALRLHAAARAWRATGIRPWALPKRAHDGAANGADIRAPLRSAATDCRAPRSCQLYVQYLGAPFDPGQRCIHSWAMLLTLEGGRGPQFWSLLYIVTVYAQAAYD